MSRDDTCNPRSRPLARPLLWWRAAGGYPYMRMFGLVLVVLGVVGLLWGGVSWTRSERVVDLGPVEVNRETRESLPLPPIAGAVLLVAGVALIVGAKR